MPVVWRNGGAPRGAPTAPAGPSTLQRLLAGAARVGSGLIGSSIAAIPGPGTAIGAGIGGLGEYAAESIEGSPHSPMKIGAEAAINAFPFGKLISGGKVLKSALQSGALTGGSTALREIAAGEDLDPQSIGLNSLLGALTGGVLGHFSSPMKSAPHRAPTEIQTTAQIGGQVLGAKGPTRPVVIPGGHTIQPLRTVDEIAALNRGIESLGNQTDQGIDLYPTQISYGEEGAYLGHGPALEGGKRSLPTRPGPSQARAVDPEEALRKQRVEVEKVHTQANTMRSREEIEAAKAQQGWLDEQAAIKANQDRLDEIARLKREGNLKAGNPAIRETISGETDLGKETATIPYGPPEDPTLTKTRPGGAQGQGGGKVPSGGQPGPGGGNVVSNTWQALLDKLRVEGSSRPFRTRPKGPVQPWSDFELTPPVEGGLAQELPEELPFGEPEGQLDLFSLFGKGKKVPRGPKTPTFRGELQDKSLEDLKARMAAEGGAQPIGEPILPVQEPAVPPAQGEPEGQGPVESLAQLILNGGSPFKNRVDAAGFGSRAIKAAKAAGEKVPEVGRRIAGQSLQEEAKAAGLPVGKAARQAQFHENAPTSGAPADMLTDDELVREVEAFKAQNGGRFGSEKGEISNALAMRLGLAAGGAAIGAAADPLGNRWASGAAGAALGAGLPSIPNVIRGLGEAGMPAEAINQIAPQLEETLAAPGGIKEVASQIWHQLPHLQRFNYLMSVPGLLANAAVGPYGSALMGAIEHGLSDDPRGWAAIKLLANPKKYVQYAFEARDEAVRRLVGGEMGRAEGLGSSVTGKVLGGPGVAMTSGDLAARRILMEAGFTEEEAKRITLTSEPELKLPKTIANWGRGKSDISTTLMDLLAPFKRTPANILEQGAQRMPGLGFLVQNGREAAGFAADPRKQQLVQQGLSLGVGTGAGLVGYEVDPETGKMVRRFVTNAAGQYSLPATIGYGVGQALQRGDNPIYGGASSAINQLPLPTTDTIMDWAKFLSGGLQTQDIPRGALPSALREAPLNRYTGLNTPKVGMNPPGIPARFRRKP